MDDKQEFVRPSLWLVYLRLFRIPNVFTAMADIFMGFLVVRGTLEPLGMFILLLGSSCFLYTAGMVLNDVYDVEQDTKERPHRPIPSGMISREWAKWLGYEMLLVGVLLAWVSGLLFHDKIHFYDIGTKEVLYRAGIIATILAVCIVSYNRWLKHTLWGPPAMGACRMFNVLLGMSPAFMPGDYWFGLQDSHLLIAGSIGLYITGVTWFARTEAAESNRRSLLGATCVMLLGILVMGCFTLAGVTLQISPIGWWLLLGLLSFSIGRRCLAAVSDPVPRKVQAAVKHAILSLIVLDASVVLAVVGPFGAVCVLALLIPTLLLGRWVYST